MKKILVFWIVLCLTGVALLAPCRDCWARRPARPARIVPVPPLIAAILHGKDAAITRILRAGGQVNTADSLGLTPLMYAVQRRDTGLARRLLDRGAHVNAAGPLGTNALFIAVMQNDPASAEILLAGGANPSAANNILFRPNPGVPSATARGGAVGRTPLLIEAIALGKHTILKILLDHGAAINAPGSIPLEGGGGQGTLSGVTALMLAAGEKNTDDLTLLLAHGADVRAADARGGTSLEWAVECANFKAAEILLSKGADVNAHYSGNAQMGLMFGASASAIGQARASAKGTTALMTAVINGDEPMTALLLAHGADVNAQNEDGKTPLILAASYAVRKGVSGFWGLKAADLPDEDHMVPVVRLLLAHGANVDAEDSASHTARSIAVLSDARKIVSLIDAATGGN